MAIALDDAPVTLNRPLLDGETLAVAIRRGVGRAGVRLVGETAAYTVWIETSGIAVLQRDGAEQGRVPVTGDAQRVALTYASGTLSASVGAYAFPLISDGTAFASLRAEFVVQGGNGQGSTFDDVTVPLPPGLVASVAQPTLSPTPTATPPMGLETTLGLNLSSIVSPVSESIASLTADSLPYALVNAGDETGFYDAVERANAGEIQAIYLNADLPTASSASAPAAQRTYELTTTLNLNQRTTIYGNNAIVTLAPGQQFSPLMRVTGTQPVALYHMHFDNVHITNPQQTVYGTVIDNQGTLSISDSTFTNNSAITGGGTVFNQRNLTLRRVSMVNNQAGGGAGIQNEGNGDVTVECSRFVGNQAAWGAGILNGQAGGRVFVRFSAFDNNTATLTSGADIYNYRSTLQYKVSAYQNYWGSTQVPKVTGIDPTNLDASRPQTNDPTQYSSGGLWQHIACKPINPEQIPDEDVTQPSVSWGTNGIRINPNSLVPPFSQNYPAQRCPTREGMAGYGETRSNERCAAAALNGYRQLGEENNAPLTWGRFLALVLYSEGHSIMLGTIQSGQLVYGNPQNEYPGSACWLYNPNVTGSWVTGSQYCQPGVQSHFPWAAAEWLFKDCAIESGFPLSFYSMTLSDGSTRIYNGECTERGLLRFLGQVQSLYGDLVNGLSFQIGPNLYASRAAIELNAFLSGTRSYGTCPCSWGNVESQTVARAGIHRPNFPSFSYFYNVAEPLPYFIVE